MSTVLACGSGYSGETAKSKHSQEQDGIPLVLSTIPKYTWEKLCFSTCIAFSCTYTRWLSDCYFTLPLSVTYSYT